MQNIVNKWNKLGYKVEFRKSKIVLIPIKFGIVDQEIYYIEKKIQSNPLNYGYKKELTELYEWKTKREKEKSKIQSSQRKKDQSS